MRKVFMGMLIAVALTGTAVAQPVIPISDQEIKGALERCADVDCFKKKAEAYLNLIRVQFMEVQLLDASAHIELGRAAALKKGDRAQVAEFDQGLTEIKESIARFEGAKALVAAFIRR